MTNPTPPQTADAINRPQMGSVSDTPGTIMMEAEDEIKALKAENGRLRQELAKWHEEFGEDVEFAAREFDEIQRQAIAADEKLEKARAALTAWLIGSPYMLVMRDKALRETEP